ncbi:MAG: hypothetical protein GVY12_03960 [Bacteroidetes bacterium]|jgi:uncharacterized protein HemX|nr:hypothetical protein [Bacteroidota bacterium]
MTAPTNDPPEQHSTRPLGRTGSRILVIIAVIVILGGSFLFAWYLVQVAEDPATQERIEQLEAQEEAEQEAQDPE